MAMARGGVTRKRVAFWALSLRHAHSSETLGHEQTKGKGNQEASLPLLQRCKNLLAANWRGQLSSVKPVDETIHGSLVQYALVGGQALVWLPKDSPHSLNLLIDNRGSLAVGHTDPRPLIHTFKAVGYVPPRAVVVGNLDPIPSSETEYIRKRVIKLVSSTKQAVENAGLQTQSILKEAGTSLAARIRALDTIIHSSMDEFSIYSMNPRACLYVDLIGGRHQIEVTDLAAATVDHLCPVLAGLVEGINQSNSRRDALVMFCAVYMRERVQDAYIITADRWGINLLANVEGPKGVDPFEDRPALGPPGLRGWKEFRFAFSHEVQNTEQFCSLLAEMERECLETLNKAQELQAARSEEPMLDA